jgi:hypothetical protein
MNLINKNILIFFLLFISSASLHCVRTSRQQKIDITIKRPNGARVFFTPDIEKCDSPPSHQYNWKKKIRFSCIKSLSDTSFTSFRFGECILSAFDDTTGKNIFIIKRTSNSVIISNETKGFRTKIYS